MLAYVISNKEIVSSMFEHHMWGLTSSITDLLIRFCTVKDIQGLDPAAYRSLRTEILQHCILSLTEDFEDDYKTEQVFEILTGIVRKCYQMHEAREFFDMLLSPFILQPILSFTFSSNQHITQFCAATQTASKQGCQFLSVLFHNMFIAEPHDAVQDVMEANFGFQLTQIAGVSVDQFKKDKQIGSEA